LEEEELEERPEFPSKVVKEGEPEWVEKLGLSTEESAGKVEEEEGFLSKEEEKPLLPIDKKELLEVSLLNGSAPPPPAIYLGSKGNGSRLIAHRVTVADIIRYRGHPLRLSPKPRNRYPHTAK
jgi:hypothetical protein